MTALWNMPQSDDPAVVPTDPGGLIAVLPSLLGFVPRDSLVALAVTDRPARRICHVLRVDLDRTEERTFAQMRPLLMLGGAREAAREHILVILGSGGERPDHLALCVRFAGSALPFGARLSAAFWARSTSAGSPWRSLIGPRARGTVPRLAPGEWVAPSREGLRERMRPNPQAQARVRRAARHLTSKDSARVVAGVEHDALRAISQLSKGLPTPSQSARFAIALRERAARDRLISQAIKLAAEGEGARVAQFWAQLSVALSGGARSEALMLAAFAWYALGNGPQAKAALEAVLAENPTHQVGQLLEACLFAGVRPEALSGLVGR